MLNMKISKQTLIMLFEILPFLMPDMTKFAPLLDSFIDIYKIIIIIEIILKILFGKQKINFKSLKLIIIFLTVYLLATILNKNAGNLERAIMDSVTILIIGMILNCGFATYPRATIKALLCILEFLLLVNCISMMIYPNGIYQINRTDFGYFLGYDNTFVPPYLALVAVSVIYSYVCKNKIFTLNTILVLFLSIITLLIRWVGSGISAMSIVIVGLLVINNRKCNLSLGKLKINDSNLYKIAYYGMGINIAVAFLRVHRIFANVIELILNKPGSLAGRESIWDLALYNIYQSPFIGYGQEIAKYTAIKMDLGNYFTVTHCHNLLINITYQTGFIGLFIFILNFIYGISILKRSKDNILTGIISLVTGAMFIALIPESHERLIYVFIMLFLMLNINNILLCKKNNNCKGEKK